MTSLNVTHIAINQYGEKHYLSTPHPRKELLQITGRSTAQKMYIDDKGGRPIHAGYVIGGEWWTLYAVMGLGPNPKIKSKTWKERVVA